MTAVGRCAALGLAIAIGCGASLARGDAVEAETVEVLPFEGLPPDAAEAAAEAAQPSGLPELETAEGQAPASEAAPNVGEGPLITAPPPGESQADIEHAWFAPADSLDQRIWRTRRTSLERGVWNLDAAARALLDSVSVSQERAEAAVRLAPDLPAAHMALAKALWLHGDSPLSAVRRAAGTLGVFWRHPEGALWLAGSLLLVLAAALIGGGLLGIAVVSCFRLPHAAHDLGDPFTRAMPGFARGALLASLLLIPVLLGEGLLGLAVGLLAVGVAYGTRPQRIALAVAALLVTLGAHPVARLAGVVLEALPADPVAGAALSSSRGLALPSDRERLAAAPVDDLLAAQARARLARREGSLGTADALYQSLLARQSSDPVLLTNAANVRLHLGHMESAFELYEKAIDVEESAVVLFNLSQAYGRAFQVDDLTRTLARAQALDGGLVADLTRLQGTQPEGFVVDLPLRNEVIWRRVLDPERGGPFAAEFRAQIAPGRLGGSLTATAGAFAAALLLGGVAGMRLRASRWCARCGRRVCPRCHPEVSGGELCGPCNRLFYQPEQTDRELRLARIVALRQREARLDKLVWVASIALPGAAGLLARRPLSGVIGALFFALAFGAVVWRRGAVPDPLVAGAAGPFAFLCVAVLAGVAYAVVVGTSLAARRNL